MSLSSMIGLEKLPPEIADALRPLILQLEQEVEKIESQVDLTIKTSLDRVDKMIQAAFDRLDGLQIVVVATVKLPEPGAKIASLPDKQ